MENKKPKWRTKNQNGEPKTKTENQPKQRTENQKPKSKKQSHVAAVAQQ